MGSEGQKSIIKLVLSIALIKLKVLNTNVILRLDEVDSVLDADNKASFEVLLNNLKDSMNIEQIFIVTHNSTISQTSQEIEFNREMKTVKFKKSKGKK